jgi:hypothetical protein
MLAVISSAEAIVCGLSTSLVTEQNGITNLIRNSEYDMRSGKMSFWPVKINKISI